MKKFKAPQNARDGKKNQGVIKMDLHDNIKLLIEETNDAFAACRGSLNTDYPGFASMALAQFKEVLEHPSLTRAQLMQALRQAMHSHRAVHDDQSNWSVFMAQYVMNSFAANDKPSV